MDRGHALRRQWLLERLRQAEDRVSQGERFIERQQTIIGQIEDRSKNAGAARKLLAIYNAMQKLRVEERDLLKAMIARRTERRAEGNGPKERTEGTD